MLAVMNLVLVGCALVIGLAAGVVAAARIVSLNAQADGEATEALVSRFHEQAVADRDAAVRVALEQAAVLHRQMVSTQVDSGRVELDQRRQLIAEQLDTVRADVRAELASMREMVDRLGSMSAQRFGEVSAQLASHAETTTHLTHTAQQLREALASPKARGQWGERMAEDVLRLAGFVEHVNYHKQLSITGGRAIPDFTFPLPKGHVLYMDVKFPLTSYLRYLEADTDMERNAHRTTFLRDVRVRVKELADREYADRARHSVDYVLLFIPNESVSGFIHESEPALIDDAMRQGVVFCSPLTLFAMLGVIRQAFDNFVIEQTSEEILGLIGAFEGQWRKFNDALDKLGRRIEATRSDYESLVGTRRRALQRPLDKLEDLRRQRGVDADLRLADAEIVEIGELDRMERELTERGAC